MFKKIKTLGPKYLKDVVYAANDGIITTFAIVASVVGASLGPVVILILGFANLLADGFSMATGSYLGTKSESDNYDKERRREEKILRDSPEAVHLEVENIFKEKGYNDEEVKTLATLITKNKNFFLDFIIFEKMGISATSRAEAIKGAVATFISFLVLGLIPLIPYVMLSGAKDTNPFLWASIFTAIALFSVGAARTFFSDESWFKGGSKMLVIGGMAAIMAYVIGAFLRSIFNGIII